MIHDWTSKVWWGSWEGWVCGLCNKNQCEIIKVNKEKQLSENRIIEYMIGHQKWLWSMWYISNIKHINVQVGKIRWQKWQIYDSLVRLLPLGKYSMMQMGRMMWDGALAYSFLGISSVPGLCTWHKFTHSRLSFMLFCIYLISLVLWNNWKPITCK